MPAGRRVSERLTDEQKQKMIAEYNALPKTAGGYTHKGVMQQFCSRWDVGLTYVSELLRPKRNRKKK